MSSGEYAAHRDSEVSGEVVLTEPVGRLGWSLALGAFGGAGGGVVMVLAAGAIARRFTPGIDVVRTIGKSARIGAMDDFMRGLAAAGVIGVVVGMLFGLLLRYSIRTISRMLAGSLLGAVVWIFVHAFVLKTYAATTLGALPSGPMIAGAAIYGLCIALLRPPRRTITVPDD